MSSVKKSLNTLFVDLFNYILSIESMALKNQGIALSMNEIHVLEAIDNIEIPTMSNVASKLLVTAGTLSISINRLVKKGYVKRKQDLCDRRKVLLELTENGVQAKRIHDEFHEEMIRYVVKDMKIVEDSQLMIALENLQAYFRAKYEENMGIKEIDNEE